MVSVPPSLFKSSYIAFGISHIEQTGSFVCVYNLNTYNQNDITLHYVMLLGRGREGGEEGGCAFPAVPMLDGLLHKGNCYVMECSLYTQVAGHPVSHASITAGRS